jgi:hypothetical protein
LAFDIIYCGAKYETKVVARWFILPPDFGSHISLGFQLSADFQEAGESGLLRIRRTGKARGN